MDNASAGRTPWQEVAERFQSRRAAAIPAQWVIPQAKLDDAQRSTIRAIDPLPDLLSPHELQITGLGASALAMKIRDREYSCLQVAEAFCHQAAVSQQLTNCLTEIFTDALEQAQHLDYVLQTTGKPIGPLHGVPVSIKDHINIKGHRSTTGYVSFASLPVKDKDAHINTKLGAGGSSGGEGVLAAMHGSPLGVGSDIGGSIRVPAAFNGVYGFKPSGNRVPMFGLECTMVGFEVITAVAGPLARNVEDLELFFQLVSDAKPWLREPLLALPWKSQTAAMQNAKLTIGIMLWDEVVMPHPYITRVIKEVEAKLKQAGHQVFDFKPYDHWRAWEQITLPIYFPDSGLNIKKAVSAGQEDLFPSSQRLLEDPIVKTLSIQETWESTPHDVKPWWGYSSQWNLLDYPAGVLPAVVVLETDAYTPRYQPTNELDKENMELYDNSMYLGMPVAIQVVGPRHEDERVIGAMHVIDKVIKNYVRIRVWAATKA